MGPNAGTSFVRFVEVCMKYVHLVLASGDRSEIARVKDFALPINGLERKISPTFLT